MLKILSLHPELSLQPWSLQGGIPVLSNAASSSTPPPPPPSAQQGRSQDAYQEDLIKLTIADLSFYYGVVKRQIILYQHPLTGLYPETSRDKEGAMNK